MVEEAASLRAMQHSHAEQLAARDASNQQQMSQLTAQHNKAVAVLQASLEEAKSGAARLQQQLAEAAGERDFFMSQSSDAAAQLACITQERDGLKERIVELQKARASAVAEVCQQLVLHACKSVGTCADIKP